MTNRPLINWRAEFPIVDTCTYLVSHSLGAMPRRTARYLQEYAEAWGTRGVRAWHEGWWEMGRTTGDLLAPLLGVDTGTISMHQNVTVAMSVIASCFSFDGARRNVVMTDYEFPSNMYLFEGLRRYGAQVVYVRSTDPVAPDPEQLLAAIDERTVLVLVSAVLFRSSCIQDMAAVIDRAHDVGAHVVLDVYQAAGTIPLAIARLRADFAVGGSVKWLCGGPGAGYLYVRPDLAATLRPALIGWAAHADPFAFATGAAVLADPPERFQSGTPNVPSLYAARAGYEIVNAIGVDAIRAWSLHLTRLIIQRAQQSGYRLNTPLEDDRRGGAVIVDVPDGAAVCQALIRREVIVDFRPGAGIRLSPHFYNTEAEVDHAMDVLDELAAARQTETVRDQT
jgi:kynureninase